MVEQAVVHELRDDVDEPGAAHADRRDIADHLQPQLITVDLDTLDRTVGGPHAALDLGGLERRAGRGGGREHALA